MMKYRLLVCACLLLACFATAQAQADAVPQADTRLLAKRNNDLAARLYAELGKKDGNVFFSPFSILAALGMTSAGARGDTLKEMEAVLGLSSQEKLHPTLGGMVREATGKGGKRAYDLAVANTLFGQAGHPFRIEFTDLLSSNYDAGMQLVDFAKASGKARLDINSWVERQTRRRITNLLRPGTVDARTRLVLVNAIYFKGAWAEGFDEDRTRPGGFGVAAGKEVRANLMRLTGRFGYAKTPEAQVLEMDYAGKALSMVVVLPTKRDGLADLAKGLTGAKLDTLIGGVRPSQVHVFFPRFKFTQMAALKPTLETLGMKLAFGGGADLSGIDGSRSLHIDNVYHKAFVEANEKGTEAAAATAVTIRPVAAEIDEPPVPTFRADHPFLFVIREKKTGVIYFMGRVSDPTKE